LKSSEENRNLIFTNLSSGYLVAYKCNASSLGIADRNVRHRAKEILISGKRDS
jgi:hypothetical protein